MFIIKNLLCSSFIVGEKHTTTAKSETNTNKGEKNYCLNKAIKTSLIRGGFYCLFTFITLNVIGQHNLVPNYSFESYVNCIDSYGNPPPPPWYMNSKKAQGIGYFNACDTSYGVGVPYNNATGLPNNYQPARTGQAYMGISTYPIQRAYLMTRLNDSLKKDRFYYVAFFVNLPNPVKYACNNTSLLFTKKALYFDTVNTSYDLYPANPQILGYGNPIVTDTMGWTKISGIYKAEGEERFIAIGNFKTYTQTQTLSVNPTGNSEVAYFIDDVSVIPLDSFCLKADAGKDTTITIGDSIFIGSYTNGIDTLKWLQNGVAIDSTRPGFWVKPTTGTSYILQQTINGCFSADTVTIGVLVLLKFIGYELRITNTVGGSLPSTLGEGLGVRSIWQTSNEINISHFNIQRSTNGKDFETIGKVKANNKSYNEYGFTDDLKTKDQYPKTLYYRIESIDKDGKISYSETKQIRLNQLTNKPINIYPNPTKGLVHISIPREEKGVWNIKVQDVTGRILQTKTTSAFTKTMDLVVSNQTGLYYITLENKTTNKKIVEKVVVE